MLGCFRNLLSDYQIRAGTTDWPVDGSLHTVVEGDFHGGFVNAEFYPDDIAVLKVTPPFVWSDLVQPVELAKDGLDIQDQTSSVICGWGTLGSKVHVCYKKIPLIL